MKRPNFERWGFGYDICADGTFVVARVIPGGVADRAGIKASCEIVTFQDHVPDNELPPCRGGLEYTATWFIDGVLKKNDRFDMALGPPPVFPRKCAPGHRPPRSDSKCVRFPSVTPRRSNYNSEQLRVLRGLGCLAARTGVLPDVSALLKAAAGKGRVA